MYFIIEDHVVSTGRKKTKLKINILSVCTYGNLYQIIPKLMHACFISKPKSSDLRIKSVIGLLYFIQCNDYGDFFNKLCIAISSP